MRERVIQAITSNWVRGFDGLLHGDGRRVLTALPTLQATRRADGVYTVTSPEIRWLTPGSNSHDFYMVVNALPDSELLTFLEAQLFQEYRLT